MAPPAVKENKPAGGKRDRNAFVRTKVPVAERVSGIVIVCLLGVIGGALWYKGRHFDPNLYSLRTDALSSTTATVEGKAGTLRVEAGAVQPGEEGALKNPAAQAATPAAMEKASVAPAASAAPSDGEGGGEAGSSAPSLSSTGAAAPAAKMNMDPMEINLPGIKPMGKTEFYNPDTLFEKIDGRAPAYLGFNFQELRSRSFSVDGADGSYVDVYEYRMDTPINAFGMFALERDANGKPVDFAPDGYSGEMGYFFRQGPVYVQIMASDQNPKTLAAAKAIALDRAKSIPVDNAGLDARRRLPSAGIVPESVTFVQDNAQGQQFLKNVFQAAYQFEGKKINFFLMLAKPDEAAAAWKWYLAFCGKFGKTSELPDVKGAKIFQAETFGKCKIIYQRDGEIGGIVDAEDAEKARKFVEEYLQGKSSEHAHWQEDRKMSTTPDNNENENQQPESHIGRREFLIRTGAAGALIAGSLVAGRKLWQPNTYLPGFEAQKGLSLDDYRVKDGKNLPSMAIAHGADHDTVIRAAIGALGGMGRFIQKGDVVMIKPNVAFDRPPEAFRAATTHPEALRAVAKLVLEAGAAKVIIADNPINSPTGCFLKSGLKQVASDLGLDLLYPETNSFSPLQLDGEILRNWTFFHEPFKKATKVIGVAPCKDHNLCHASMTTKNWYGLLGGRRNQFHQHIHSIVSDFALMMKPTLVVLDGMNVLMKNGPTGGRLSDVKPMGTVVAGTDMVAVDSYGYTHLLERDLAELTYIHKAHARGLGNKNWKEANYKEVQV